MMMETQVLEAQKALVHTRRYGEPERCALVPVGPRHWWEVWVAGRRMNPIAYVQLLEIIGAPDASGRMRPETAVRMEDRTVREHGVRAGTVIVL